jgi:hypothetical protein
MSDLFLLFIDILSKGKTSLAHKGSPWSAVSFTLTITGQSTVSLKLLINSQRCHCHKIGVFVVKYLGEYESALKDKKSRMGRLMTKLEVEKFVAQFL